MKFFVFGQNLKVAQRIIASGTARVLTADFRFSPEWDGMRKYAHFEQGDKKYPVLIENDKITADKNLNLGQGTWEVWVHGNQFDDDANFQRITTVKAKISVDPSGLCGDPLPIEPPSFGEQLDQRVTALEAGGGGGTTDHSKLTNRDQPNQHPMEAITGLAELRDKINAFLDADDSTLDQLTELIAAIKENQGTIEQLTNGKVNVSDIVNDLTTGGAGKVLSAEMGKELKRLIDTIEPPDLAAQVEAAQTAAREAGQSASTASAAAGSAESAAETARGHAESAAQSATTAQEQANRAQEIADSLGQGGSGLPEIGPDDDGKTLFAIDGKPKWMSLDLGYGSDGRLYLTRGGSPFGRGVEVGTAPETTWKITNSLTNCATDNQLQNIKDGQNYSATITADEGYTLEGATVAITMGGKNITSDAYSAGKITIDSVTGSLSISVTAKKAEAINWHVLEYKDLVEPAVSGPTVFIKGVNLPKGVNAVEVPATMQNGETTYTTVNLWQVRNTGAPVRYIKIMPGVKGNDLGSLINKNVTKNVFGLENLSDPSENLFYQCQALECVPQYPMTYTSKKSPTFNGCSSITDASGFIMPPSVTELSVGMFANCAELVKGCTIPVNVVKGTKQLYWKSPKISWCRFENKQGDFTAACFDSNIADKIEVEAYTDSQVAAYTRSVAYTRRCGGLESMKLVGIDKPTVNIACFGDSTTQGQIPECWPSYFQAKPGVADKIIWNRGVSGDTMEGILSQMKKYPWYMEAETVTILGGANMSAATNSVESYMAALNEMTSLLKTEQFIIMTPAGDRNGGPERDKAIIAKYGDHFLNLRQYFIDHGYSFDQYMTDGIHFTAEGYAKVADAVYEHGQRLGYWA